MTAMDVGARASQIVAVLEREGFVVLEGALPSSQLRLLRHELDDALARTPFGRNDFEGRRTRRVYSLLSVCPSTAVLAEAPKVLEVADALLAPNFLLSAHLAIEIHPQEIAQPIHYDDGFYLVPRPRPPFGISAIWAIDDFTLRNGATEVIPGSHTLGVEPPNADEALPIEMPAGSVLLLFGTTWHRGGANRSERTRLAVTTQYCEPWARQQEQMTLSVPASLARELSPRLRSMLGYSIHPPFMGHVAGLHPQRLLDLPSDEQDGAARSRSSEFWERSPAAIWRQQGASL